LAAPAAHSLRPFFARAAVDPEPGAPREPHEVFAELGPEVSFDPLSRALRGESALEALAAGGG